MILYLAVFLLPQASFSFDWVGPAIAIVGALGMVAVYLRGSADKGTIASQDRLIKAQGDEIADLNRRVTTAESGMENLKSENRFLKGAVAHVEELVVLQTTVEQHHQMTVEAHAQMMIALRAIASAVGE